MEIDVLLCGYGLLIGLIMGALSGTLAGLAGLGGGLIYVPVFLLVLPENTSNNIALHVMASMVGVLITSAFSARSHWRLGHVDIQTAIQLVPGLMVGAALGLWLTLEVPAVIVLITLALLDAWIAIDYGRNIKQRKTSLPLLVCSGPIGYISGTLGIAGGTMLVPLLRRQLSLRHAVGTSTMCGVAMAVVAVWINVMLEPKWLKMLSDHGLFLGSVFLGLILILPYTSAWSAQLHVQFSEVVLQGVLKILFIALSVFLLSHVWILL